MVSGKYSALSGAVAREQALDSISANLANVHTTGFRKNRISFESILRDAKQVGDAKGINYARIRKIGSDFEQGAVQQTGNPLDVAITGEGFFKIQKGQQSFYTRAGHFIMDEEGILRTSEGHSLLGPNSQPVQLSDPAGKAIDINETGGISLDGLPTGESIAIFNVSDEQRLKPAGNTLFSLEDGTDLLNTESKIIQGSLESSNVNMMEEMAFMISAQRKFEAHIKVLESYSKLSEKQNELGTVG